MYEVSVLNPAGFYAPVPTRYGDALTLEINPQDVVNAGQGNTIQQMREADRFFSGAVLDNSPGRLEELKEWFHQAYPGPEEGIEESIEWMASP